MITIHNTDPFILSSDVTCLTRTAMHALPIEVLHLHLSSRSLETMGNYSALAKWLYAAIYGDIPDPTSPQADTNTSPS